MPEAAKALRTVPYEPAYDFYSALQGIWILHMILSCYIGARDYAFGNFDKYMLPFYEKALADGKTEQRGICYNYHWTLKDLRFVTIVVDLGKEQEISGLKLVAFQNNEAYKPSFFEVAASSDNVSYRDIAKGDQWETRKRYLRVAQVAAKDTKCRYLRIKIGTAVAWINISEIEVYGK